MSVCCRRAGIAEAPAFAAIHALCFDRAWDDDAFARLLTRQGALGLLAFRAKAADATGFVLFDLAADEAEILTIGVHPACRGQGIAAALISAGSSELEGSGVRLLHLEVAADNLPALALYRASGFTESGRRAGYYPSGPGRPPVDALLMRRCLGS